MNILSKLHNNKNYNYFSLLLVFILLASLVIAKLITTIPEALSDIIVPSIVASLIIIGLCNLIISIKKTPTTIFITKLILITYIIRFTTAIIVYLLEFHILNVPTINDIPAIGIDNDNWQYHTIAINIVEGFNLYKWPYFLSFLGIIPKDIGYNDYVYYLYAAESTKFYGFIVAIFYYIFGFKIFIPILFNCISASFCPALSYLICKEANMSDFKSKLIGYIIALSFTVSAYSSVLMRDVFIMLFTLLCIYLFARLFNTKNYKYLFLLLPSLYILSNFRQYAAIAIIFAIFTTLYIKYVGLKVTPLSIVISIIGLVVLVILYLVRNYIGVGYIIYLVSDVENLLYISDTGYAGATSTFGVDRHAMASNIPLFYLFGLVCMTFAPFPWQWIQVKNVVQLFVINEMIVYYVFIIPSLFFGIKKLFEEKNTILLVCFFYIFSISSFYGLIFDNAGAVFRGRSTFLPLIFIICLYNSKGLLLYLESLVYKYLNGFSLNIQFKKFKLCNFKLP